MTTDPSLDVITLGRASVDLYAHQIGGRLEDVGSFAKSVGGCPANIAIGSARLGLRVGFITRVGDEHMGRFVREQLEREGVDVTGVKTDPARLTALVLLAVRDDETFPLIFYRTECADMALEPSDVNEAFVARAGAVLVTGTHFSRPNVEAASRRAIAIAKAHGRKVIFDVDYRPNLWGLAGHDAGEARYVASAAVSERLSSVLADCDLVVGTEEELLIASGETEILAALHSIRERTQGLILLKRGPMGCVAYPGPIPERVEDGVVGRGFPVEVYNVLGAGDAFLSGFLRGWLRGEPLETACTWANACGAFAVSRLLCSPETPSFEELTHFLATGLRTPALRKDEDLNHLHWVATRRGRYESLCAFAIDHRSQLEALADQAGAERGRISEFKRLAVRATARVADGRDGFGMLLDDTYGREALFDASRLPLWIARPLELPGSRPVAFEHGRDLGGRLLEWPVTHCMKILSFYRTDDPEPMRRAQEHTLLQAFEASRRIGRELLVEVIVSKNGSVDDDTTAASMRALYAAGIKPDWWKIEPQGTAMAWDRVEAAIAEGDPHCRGILMLGLEAPVEKLTQAFALAGERTRVRGFAVGRTVFGDAARAWFAGQITDEQAVDDMAGRFERLVTAWQNVERTRKVHA